MARIGQDLVSFEGRLYISSVGADAMAVLKS